MEIVCCCCNLVKKGDSWVKQLPDHRKKEQTHGYCPKCFSEIMDKLDSRNAREQVPVVGP